MHLSNPSLSRHGQRGCSQPLKATTYFRPSSPAIFRHTSYEEVVHLRIDFLLFSRNLLQRLSSACDALNVTCAEVRMEFLAIGYHSHQLLGSRHGRKQGSCLTAASSNRRIVLYRIKSQIFDKVSHPALQRSRCVLVLFPESAVINHVRQPQIRHQPHVNRAMPEAAKRLEAVMSEWKGVLPSSIILFSPFALLLDDISSFPLLLFHSRNLNFTPPILILKSP